MTVKLASTLPSPSINGLESIASSLVDSPSTTHVVIAVIDCSKITTDTDSGDEVPTVRVRQIEVANGAEQGRAEAMMRRLKDHRTGKRPLFDADPYTGEIPPDA